MIAELFTEGVPLFDLSQLLAYRKGLFQTEQVLVKIEDRSIRELVRSRLAVGSGVLLFGTEPRFRKLNVGTMFQIG